jgi:multimeric flavodoxin WrbA
MKVVILNGSPRLKGNTRTAALEIERGIKENVQGAVTELIDASVKNIHPCKGCDACRKNGGQCIQKDDMPAILDSISQAEVLVFATPVYYWGITAQLKALIDRFYCKKEFHNQKKTIGIFVDGEAELDDPEYRLIKEQINCISEYLGWTVKYTKCVTTTGIDTVKKDEEVKKELYNFYKCL